VHTVSLNSIQIKPLYKWWSIFCKTRCRSKQHTLTITTVLAKLQNDKTELIDSVKVLRPTWQNSSFATHSS